MPRKRANAALTVVVRQARARRRRETRKQRGHHERRRLLALLPAAQRRPATLDVLCLRELMTESKYGRSMGDATKVIITDLRRLA